MFDAVKSPEITEEMLSAYFRLRLCGADAEKVRGHHTPTKSTQLLHTPLKHPGPFSVNRLFKFILKQKCSYYLKADTSDSKSDT